MVTAKFVNYLYNNDGIFLMTIYIPSGSIYEHVGKFKEMQISGTSHFLEHLLFKHTENFSGKEILQNFAKLGGYYNASTDKDQTMFYVKTLVNNYMLAVDLLIDIVLKPKFMKSEIITERQVVLEEYTQTQDSSEDMMYEGSNRSILGNDNIYLPSVIGYKSHLQRVSYEKLWEYYHARFKHAMILINCDRKHSKEIQRYLSTKLTGRLDRPINFDESSFESKSLSWQEPSKRVLVDVVESYQYNTVMSYPAFPFKNIHDGIVLNFLKFCLTDAGLYSILSYEIREKRGLVYSIKTSNDRMRYIGLFKIAFGTSNKDVVSIVKVVQDILKDLVKKGLDAETLKFFKISYLNHLKYRFINEDHRLNWYGDNLFYGVKLNEEKLFSEIAAIDNSHIKKISQYIFDPEKVCIYTMGNYHDANKLKAQLLSLNNSVQHLTNAHDAPKVK
jgi:predicted Zn-dependent peptidase